MKYYITAEETLEFANQLVDEHLDDNEISKIQEFSKHLNPPLQKKTKGIITYKDWLDNFLEEEEIFRKLEAKVSSMIEEIQNHNETTKIKSIDAISSAIRARQEELGFTKYLANNVKISVMSTARRYMNEKERWNQPLSKPKSKKKKQSKKNEEKKIDLDLKVSDFGSKNSHLFIEGEISNPNDFPLQNLRLTVKDNSNTNFEITEALGAGFDSAGEQVYIPILKASMQDQKYRTKFKLIISSYASLEDGFNINLELDNNFNQKTITKEFEF